LNPYLIVFVVACHLWRRTRVGSIHFATKRLVRRSQSWILGPGSDGRQGSLVLLGVQHSQEALIQQMVHLQTTCGEYDQE